MFDATPCTCTCMTCYGARVKMERDEAVDRVRALSPNAQLPTDLTSAALLCGTDIVQTANMIVYDYDVATFSLVKNRHGNRGIFSTDGLLQELRRCGARGFTRNIVWIYKP